MTPRRPSARLGRVKQMMLVGLGGALGALVRWKMAGTVLHHTADWKFPLGTFLVNLAGCIVAGLLAGLVTKRDVFSPDTRLFLFTGVLGGFTTFSAFGVETVYLLRRMEFLVAFLYVVLSVMCGIAGLFLAMWAVTGKASN